MFLVEDCQNVIIRTNRIDVFRILGRYIIELLSIKFLAITIYLSMRFKMIKSLDLIF